MKLTILFILVAVIAAVAADYASIYHKQVTFAGAGCGVPGHSWTGKKGIFNKGRKKRGDVAIFTWRARHSYVTFRGKCFEWGDVEWYYQDGGIGRDDAYCPDDWVWYKGQSRCTLEQAQRLGAWYANNKTYWALFNNCHNYAQWLMNRLLKNRCYI